MKFPGVDDVLRRYQESFGCRRRSAWVLVANGLRGAPDIGKAVNAVGKIDQKLIAEYIHRDV